MRLTIHIHAPEGESLLVTVGEQIQRSDEEHRSLQFNLLAGTYPVEFRQETEGHSFHIAKLLAFLIFMVPWGILNVLLMNVDTGWWKNCKTFCLKVETAIDLQQDEELSFRFVNAKYEESRWAGGCRNTRWNPLCRFGKLPSQTRFPLPMGICLFLLVWCRFIRYWRC